MSDVWTCAVACYRPAYLAPKKRWVPGWKPEPQVVTWPQMCRALTHHVEVPVKERAWAWSPVVIEGDRRCNEAVREVTAVVLDLDSGTDIDSQLARFTAWRYVAHTSFSHAPHHPKARIVLPLLVPIPVSCWPRAWRWAQDQAGQHADEAAKDASRVYFLPSCPPGAPRKTWLNDDDLLPTLDLRPFDSLPPPYRADRRPIPPVRTRPVALPSDSAADRVTRERWAWDPALRRRAADMAGAHVAGNTAKGLPCPACSRPSVWFYIEGNTSPFARCSHKNSCGWFGPVWEACGNPSPSPGGSP